MFPWSYDAAYLGCMIANIMREKGRKPFAVSDFMPADSNSFDQLDETWENLRKLAEE